VKKPLLEKNGNDLLYSNASVFMQTKRA